MKFKIDEHEHTNTICITVLIVEDSFEQAIGIKNAVESYNSILNNKKDIFRNKMAIEYNTVINGKEELIIEEFMSEEAFNNSLDYLKKHTNTVDIILCDFDLGIKKGNEFLSHAKELEKNSVNRWYRVLHSVGWEYQKFNDMSIVDFQFDAKNKEAIQEVILKTFEEKILITILFGNSTQYRLYYDIEVGNHFRILDRTNKYFRIAFERILAVFSTPGYHKRFSVYYLSDDYSIKEITSEESLKDLKTSISFVTIGRSLVVNKLWIGDVDIVLNKIKFLRHPNAQYVLNIHKEVAKKKHKTRIIDFLHTLISNDNTKTLEEFKSQYHYFHFSS